MSFRQVISHRGRTFILGTSSPLHEKRVVDENLRGRLVAGARDGAKKRSGHVN